jgi:hypothetical protein
MKDIYQGILANGQPLDYYELFLTHDIIELIVDQTNLYACQYLLRNDTSTQSRLHAWKPVDSAEVWSFLGLIGWMGLVKLPAIRDYWRKHKLYGLPFARTVMSRNRFEMILKFVHFSDNEEETRDRLSKVRNVLEKFVNNYQSVYTPGMKICVDESLIPWRERLIFRQYIPNKRHRYGIKVFKLCTDKGYTYNLSVYCGKSKEKDKDVSETVVMDLTKGLLDNGRTLYTDNYYTSIPLAYRLKHRKTDLVGTLRTNRKYISKEVIGKALKKGEIACMETDDGKIAMTKWRDKRNVMTLSTKHSARSMQTVTTKTGRSVLKPSSVIDYNTGKSSIDISDQMASYSSALRRCVKWYRKLVFELVWGTSLVNAYYLYSKYSRLGKLTITEFREKVIEQMIDKHKTRVISTESKQVERRNSSSTTHKLIDNISGNPPKSKRGRCKGCYEIYGKKGTIVDGKRKYASQVKTICSICKVFFCRNCFNKAHP